MFEKTPPIPHLDGTARFGGNPGAHDVSEEAQLRPIDWNELTARLNAARDLRRVLQRDVSSNGSEFADAAARFLNARDGQETDVNLVALEHAKGSPGMISGPNANNDETKRNQTNGTWWHAANAGDARED